MHNANCYYETLKYCTYTVSCIWFAFHCDIYLFIVVVKYQRIYKRRKECPLR